MSTSSSLFHVRLYETQMVGECAHSQMAGHSIRIQNEEEKEVQDDEDEEEEVK